MRKARLLAKGLLALALTGAALAASPAALRPALADGVLRIAMTATDIPTTTGMPNNGFEGMRFLGYPIFEGLVQWDLSRSDKLAGVKPALAESYEQAPDDKKTWIFKLRKDVKFHDGTDFNADAVIWNLDRYFKNDSPQYEPPAAGMTRARVPVLASYRKVDDFTVAIVTKEAASYFPYMAVYILFAAPSSFDKGGRDWAKVATLPPAGTGPFKLSRVVPREVAELTRFDGYWDSARKAKLDTIRLIPIPEATARMAALRSGQVDWIEVPPPDGIDSLKGAGFSIVTNSYPHVWPWMFNMAAPGSPFKDVRVRQGLNYCFDRAGLVTLLSGTAEPSVGWLKANDPNFGNPKNRYGFDPVKGKALLAEAGYTAQKPLTFKVMVSTSGSGQMLPLPMNEYMQENLKQSCGVNVELEAVEWTVLLTAVRFPPDSPNLKGSMALNVSSPSSDVGIMFRYFSSANFSPNGFNFEQWKDDEFDAALAALAEAKDEATIAASTKKAHERLVDNPPWLFIVHDLNPRAMSTKVQGFVSAQSWFLDMTLVSMK